VRKQQKKLENQKWKNSLLEKKGVSLMLSNAKKEKRTKSLIMLWGIYNPLSIQLEHYPS
jgi:hypothetical protein